MADYELLLRWLHVVGAAVLLGTGAGIAFFMIAAVRTGDARLIAGVARIVVAADLVFTASAAVVQPLTGLALAQATGWALTEGWIVLSLVLYVFTGLCWLPVVWIQIRLRRMAQHAASSGGTLPKEFFRLYRIWLVLGWPAFAAVLGIFWLMIARPAIPLW
jgi:uncharacterized membrane protein